MQRLKGKVAVVTGATRGAGRGIALQLGEAGATVYVTGRSIRGKPATANRPETIEETAEMVNTHGGRGIAVQVDHTVEEQVRALFERVKQEQGRLDLLVNSVWGGDALTEWNRPFWELTLQKWAQMQRNAVETHLIASTIAVPLMLERGKGLIVSTTDGEWGTLYYNLAKSTLNRMMACMAEELRPHGIAAVTLRPGFMRTEAVLDTMGTDEEHWQSTAPDRQDWQTSETPQYIGRAVVALASDANVLDKSGHALVVSDLAVEYEFTDIDGSRPVFGVGR
jgi:NAD(P)-dependent dehydrogenase (short-subunit alcohol dehydrogenase family)